MKKFNGDTNGTPASGTVGHGLQGGNQEALHGIDDGSSRREPRAQWPAAPATPAQAELHAALNQARGKEADEVALRRIWARLAEVPTLVPAADGRDEDGLHQVQDGRATRVRWPWIVAASLAGATATLAFMLIESQAEFRSAGRVIEARAGQPASGTISAGADAGQRSILVAPATVRTGFGETLHLSLRGGTEVLVTSESTLVLDQNDHPSVSAGEVQFHVPHQVSGQTFVVAAGEYRVVVVGTRFRVRVNHANAAVGVDEGIVEVWNDHGRIARVAAGQSWIGPAQAQDGAPSNHPNAVNEADTRDAPVVPPSAKGVSAAQASRPTGRSSWTAPGSGHDRATRNGARILALASPSSSAKGAGIDSDSSGGPAATGSATPAVRSVEPAASASIAPASAPMSPPSLALQARAARAAGDSRRALGLYRALAQAGGPVGENAEYEVGRVLRDGLNQPREAVSAWLAYRTQHPRGMLRIEADISVIETLVSLGDKTAAESEAADFIRRYPDSERRSEIARLAGDLLRERGDCGGAIRAYDVALGNGHGRGDIADAASFHRAICVLRGNPEPGAAALRGYLDSFPAGRFRREARLLLSDRPPSDNGPVAPR